MQNCIIGLDTKIKELLSPFHIDIIPYFFIVCESIYKKVWSSFDNASLVWSIQKGLTNTVVMLPAIAEEHIRSKIVCFGNNCFIFS